MRLCEIEDIHATGRLTNEELGLAYDRLMRSEMTKEEINDFAKDFTTSGRYPRTAGSLIFVMSRMHILLHGVAPEGETQSRADTMFNIPQSMIDYVLGRGDLDEEDLRLHIRNAEEDLAARPVRLRKEDALKVMSEFYRAHKPTLPKDIGSHREEILSDIMNGVPAEQAFAKYS